MQSEKLVKQIKHVWDNCPPYRKLMEEKGVNVDLAKALYAFGKAVIAAKNAIEY